MVLWAFGWPNLSPLLGKHRVHDMVDVAVVEPLYLPHHALLRETEPLGYCTATGVLGSAADLDAIELQI
jgi:hypothetical protein